MRRFIVLLVAVGGLLAFSSTVSATVQSPAAFPGTPGDIVFTSSKTGNRQIWLLHPNGTETNLSNSATQDSDPEWSPAGTRIAFTRGHDIWVMHADGTHQVNLTNSAVSNGGPVWSPDGTKIAFVSDRDVNSEEIYVMSSNGSHVRRLTTNSMTEHNLEWSPDGTKIAFDANNGSNEEIYTVNAKNGSALTDLTNNAANDDAPDWSPDGSKIAFSSSRTAGANLWVMNANGSAPVALGTPNSYADADAPAWSPDGSQLVYAANWGLGSEQLWEVAADGSDYGSTGSRLTQDSGNPLNTQPGWQPVHVVTLAAQPNSAVAGAAITISGGGFLANERVKLVFRDAEGASTALGTATASAAGSFAFPSTVPAGAAAGKAHITATAPSGLSKKITFVVTS